jgi:hypothetical protein
MALSRDLKGGDLHPIFRILARLAHLREQRQHLANVFFRDAEVTHSA